LSRSCNQTRHVFPGESGVARLAAAPLPHAGARPVKQSPRSKRVSAHVVVHGVEQQVWWQCLPRPVVVGPVCQNGRFTAMGKVKPCFPPYQRPGVCAQMSQRRCFTVAPELSLFFTKSTECISRQVERRYIIVHWFRRPHACLPHSTLAASPAGAATFTFTARVLSTTLENVEERLLVLLPTGCLNVLPSCHRVCSKCSSCVRRAATAEGPQTPAEGNVRTNVIPTRAYVRPPEGASGHVCPPYGPRRVGAVVVVVGKCAVVGRGCGGGGGVR